MFRNIKNYNVFKVLSVNSSHGFVSEAIVTGIVLLASKDIKHFPIDFTDVVIT